MRNPTIDDSFFGNQSRYSLVIAVAKRAREIASQAEMSGDILLEKPVNMAIAEFTANKYKIIRPERED
jgi:DNA-directed RNA polymerase subunit omega